MSDVAHRAETALRGMQASLLEVNVSVGRCVDCPLYKCCRHSNDSDATCRLASQAVAEFVAQILLCPWILPEDYPGIRSLASIHASMILAEEYFRVFGSVNVKRYGRKIRTMEFRSLHLQYTRLQEKLQSGLEKYGLTPSGRRLLRTGDRQQTSKKNPLRGIEDYIDAHYSLSREDLGEIIDRQGNVIQTPAHVIQAQEPTREGEHSGVLPGSAAPQPATSGDAGSGAEGDLRTSDIEVSA